MASGTSGIATGPFSIPRPRERDLTPPSAFRRAGRLALLAGAVVVPAATAISTYIGTRVLTDAPRVRRLRPTLKARFHSPATAARDHHMAAELTDLDGSDATVPGVWGLSFDGGFAQVTDPVDVFSEQPTVVRPYKVLDGEAPTAEVQHDRRHHDRREDDRAADADDDVAPDEDDRSGGDRRQQDVSGPWPVNAALAPHAWPEDPQILAKALGATWSIDAVPAPGGYLPVWVFRPAADSRGREETWLIGIHGRGARRSELFRLVGAALRGGVTCAVVSYRTDQWTAQPATLTTLGSTEWEDAEAAVRLALWRGARRVVVAGYSLGGAITAMLLRRSRQAALVSGVILDSPALNWGPILQHIAAVRHIPSPIVPLVMTVARWRADLDWSVLNQVARAEEFRHPILLIHGTADTVVPVWQSDAFAAARPDLVTYERFEGARHVACWNADPVRYERAVERFLDQVTTGPGPTA